jgi:hypothetical protein
VYWLTALCGLLTGCASEDLSGGLGPAVPGNLLISVQGLPAGAASAISISSAQGYQRSVSGPETLSGLQVGSYAVLVAEVVIGGDRYVPAAPSQSIKVSPGATTTVQVVYVLVTARLSIVLSGIPSGATTTLLVTGPAGFSKSLATAETLTGLLPGTYTVQALSFSIAGDRYQVLPESREVVLATPDTLPVLVPIEYQLATGRLVIEVGGVPAGATATIWVTGPDLNQLITHTDTLAGLTPGSYTVSAEYVLSGGYSYAPAPTGFSVQVVANPEPSTAQVSYGVSTGGLQVTASGLPPAGGAEIQVVGPGGFSQTLSGSQLFTNLAPGQYTIHASSVTAGGDVYIPEPTLQVTHISAGVVPALASVSYAMATATLTVTVSGLSAGTSANILVTGPAGFAASLAGSAVIAGLAPGQYNITANNVSSSGVGYGPQPAAQTAVLNGGGAATVTVAYAATDGALSVTISGLPGGTGATVAVSGPGGFAQNISASQTLSGLVPGTYAINAANVSSGGTLFTPTPSSQSVAVAAGTVAQASVGYAGSAGGGGPDLLINGAYVTQATQKYDGSVPLVAGRDAMLRVFALASQPNTLQPQVRVRLYNGSNLLQTYSVSAAGASVPTSVDESSLTKSWNLLIPAALVQPGLKVLADVDPGNTVAESNEGNNQFPVSGSPAGVEVRALPVFAVRLVPVLQQVSGLQGNVTGANQEAFLADLKKQLPVGPYDAEVRAPYTTTAPALQSNDGNGAWGTILSEVLALRSADASSRYYYGVVKVSYGSGVAGLGYVGGSARTAIGWDYLSSGAHVMAHEVGHNMGRWHAPCGGPSGTDASYPYVGGQIGVWGMDLPALQLKDPATADLMSYCGPSWVSDYNWTGMLGYRQSGPNNAPEDASGSGPGLLIWGRITPSGVVLEPAFRVPARQAVAPRNGANRLELLAADGSLLRSVAFETTEVADLPGGAERHFAFVLPLDAQLEAALAGLRVVAAEGRRSAAHFALAAPGSDPGPLVSRPSPQQVEVRWDAARFPMVLVRDAASGQILSFARGGLARIFSTGQSFELQFSDGLKSLTRPARVLR